MTAMERRMRWWPMLAGVALALGAPMVAYAQPYPTIEPQRPVAITV